MNPLSITVSVGDLVPSGMRVDASSFPTLSLTIKAVAEAAQQQWVSYAMGEPLPTGQTIRGGADYARSIQLRQVGDFAAEVYSETAFAQGVEYGFPQRDMKDVLTRSLKVRMVKDPKSPNFGKRYLIIPFRWAAQGKGGAGNNVMPQAVASWWKGKSASSVTRWTERKSGAGMIDGNGVFHGVHDVKTKDVLHVPQRVYDWGDRLRRGDMSGLGIKGTGARRAMQGMVKFGSGAGASYMTFRTMMEGSSGWIKKATPGKYPARAVAQQMERVAEEAFRKAIEEDVRKALEAL